MIRRYRTGRFAALRRHWLGAAAALAACTAWAPAAAMQLLDAADHGELEAEVSAHDVSRIALLGDRIVRVVRAPDGFPAEHDPASGDLWLLPADGRSGAAPEEPMVLFVGTEKGFTYRLRLTPAARGAAQILIRNPEAVAPASARQAAADTHIAAVTTLVRAVATGGRLPGYAIEAGGGEAGGMSVIERWRGPRLEALVLDPGTVGSAPEIAARLGPDAAAVWREEPGVDGKGIAVAVLGRAGDGR